MIVKKLISPKFKEEYCLREIKKKVLRAFRYKHLSYLQIGIKNRFVFDLGLNQKYLF